VTYSTSEAAERNKAPILAILSHALAHSRRVLEIGSGTGQHAVHFAAHLPHLTWQPTDRSEYLEGLQARIAREGTSNLRPALELDVRALPWQVEPVDAVFTANTLHIMSWSAVEDLFRGVGAVLLAPAVLCIYGPFRYKGQYTSASNAEFDRYLQARDPDSGIRDFTDVNTLSSQQGLHLLADHSMPANNQLLIWHKTALSSQTSPP
jgi:cyclopropane fatty-acyl-phospholipid synthase-like methyltransferase